MSQTTNSILMIRPVAFRKNEQTALNNFYQKNIDSLLPAALNAKAQQEFDSLVEKLRAVGVSVIVVDDTPENDTPDSVFPNNWISFHDNGDVALYPMFAENRRLERREDILDIVEEHGFVIESVMDYTDAEDDDVFLEGTGSVVLDRAHGKAYCALSPRADEELFIEFCEDFELSPIIFNAYQTVDDKRELIYHTNVMMSVGAHFAVICSESIDDKTERKSVIESLKQDGKDIIYITEKQVSAFAGNMLEVKGAHYKSYVVMSTTAHQSLTEKQIAQLEQHATIISSNLDTIETCGGGSARCMIAEIFLPRE